MPSSARPRALVPVLVMGAGALGAAGVAISAAAAHRGGGDLASTAGLFCLLHAAAALAGAAYARGTRSPVMIEGAVLAMILGTALFAGDLVAAGFYGLHPLPAAAPVGGVLMIVAWLLVIAAGVREAMMPRG